MPARAVASSHGWPTRAASVSAARLGVAAMPPKATHAAVTMPASTVMPNAAQTAEMSSSNRFDSLYVLKYCGPRKPFTGTRSPATNSPSPIAVFW
ncbi:hypothetical protein D3C81_1931890 [compost metagenome]